MRKILLHVGTHKTGTTSLQRTFFQHRDDLISRGIHYLGGDGAYEHLYSAFMTRPMEFEWNRFSGLSEAEIRARDKEMLSDLQAQLVATECETVIISSEYLSMLDEEEQGNLKAFLDDFGTVTAVYYYRELLSWMSSDSQQLAKVGMRSGPTEFATAMERLYDMPLRVRKVFGEDNTRFVRFEDAVKTGICNSFLAAFGLPTLDALGLEEIRANESISADAVRALYLYNRLFPRGSGTRQPSVVQRLRELEGTKYELAGLTEAQIDEYGRKQAHISDLLGLNILPPSALPVSPSTDPLAEEMVTMVNRFVRIKNRTADRVRPPAAESDGSAVKFILGVGAQKAGTSWLYRYLDSHPQCAMGPFKEMCFFSDPAVAVHTKNPVKNRSKKLKQAWQLSLKQKANPAREERLTGLLEALLIRHQPERYAEAYKRIVAHNPDRRLIGDITPDYAILHPKDVKYMKAHLDGMGYDIKVVFLMRDPVSRCFSAAKMRDHEQQKKSDRLSVGNKNDLAGEDFVKFATSRSCVSRTRYELTIKALERSFDPSQIYYGIYEEFFQTSEIKRLCGFLEIDYVEPNLRTRKNASRSDKALSSSQAEAVRAFYAETYEFCRNRFGAEKIDRLWGR